MRLTLSFVLLFSVLLVGVPLGRGATSSYQTTDTYPDSIYRITTYSTFYASSSWQHQSSPTWDYCGPTNNVTCSQRAAIDGVYPPYTGSNIFWGKAASTSGVSGMGFNGLTKTSPCTPSACNGKGIIPGGSVPIDIGQLVHYNYPIYSGSYVDFFQMTVYVTIDILTTPATKQGPYPFTFTFYVNETLNQYSKTSCSSVSNGCCYFVLSSSASPCADKIYLVSGTSDIPNSDTPTAGTGIDVSQTKNFVINGVNYTFAITGLKDTTDVTSNSKYYFISDEKGATVSYLFASLIPACPSASSCNGSKTLVLNTGNVTASPPIAPSCTCQCPNSSDVTLGYCTKTGLTATGYCTCGCDSTYCLNNGTGKVTGTGANQTCSCDCSTASCASSTLQTVQQGRCGCVCNTAYCSQQAYQQTDCTCKCPDSLCQSPYTADSQCNCVCGLKASNCTGTKNVFDNSTCSCLCQSKESCSPNNGNWAIDPSTCACTCPSTMATTCAKSNQNVNSTSCSCSTCIGSFTSNGTSTCGYCPLNATYCTETYGYSFNATTCSCQSCTTAATCDIEVGLVPENNNPCKCRNCTVGECKCGNGIIEAGETCDDGKETTCCVNCQLPTTCQQDLCQQAGVCQMVNQVTSCVQTVQKCVSSDCQVASCNGTTGTCSYENLYHSKCGNESSLCNKWCESGVCVDRVSTGTSPVCSSLVACQTSSCDASTGFCSVSNLPDGTSCDDGNKCTGSSTNPDQCQSGTCTAGEQNGPCSGITSLGPCYNLSCDALNGRCNRFILENIACDDQNPCTTQDKCTSNGICHGTLLSCNTPSNVAPNYPALSDLSDWTNFCLKLGSDSTTCQSDAATELLSYSLSGLCSSKKDIFCNSQTASYTALCPFVEQVCKVKDIIDSTDPLCRFLKCDSNATSSTQGLCIDASGLLSGSSCDDGNNCTSGDSCSTTGTCSSGDNICVIPVGGDGSDNTVVIATSVAAGAAVAAAAIAGLLVKRLMDSSGLADPFTWGDLNPTSASQNPLYEPAVSTNENPLFAANSNA